MEEKKVSIKFSSKIFLRIAEMILKSYKLIIISSIMYGFVIVSISLFVYYNYPLRTRGRLEFTINKLVDGRFPNGTKFNLNEIISPKVLHRVYERDKMSAYFKSFNNFRDAISVTKETSALMFLQHEYNSKLNNDDLPYATKIGLEKEFLRKMENIVNSSNYLLILDTDETRRGLSPDQVQKILVDVLGEWFQIAIEHKGIDKNNLSLHNRSSITPDTLKSMGFLRAIDVLRVYLNEVGKDIKKLEDIPNSKFVKIKDRDKTYSLSDLQLKFNFLKDHQLDPLIGIIKEYFLDNTNSMNNIYIKNKLNAINKEKYALEERSYLCQKMDMDMNPQDAEMMRDINNRLIDLKKEELFYKDIQASMNTPKGDDEGKTSNNFASTAKTKQMEYELLNSIYSLIDLVHEFNTALAKADLGVSTSYYSIIGSGASINRGVNLKNVLTIAVIAWIVCIAITFKLIFIIKYFIPDLKKNISQIGEI